VKLSPDLHKVIHSVYQDMVDEGIHTSLEAVASNLEVAIAQVFYKEIADMKQGTGLKRRMN
jgi:hypothetical protein